MIMYKTHVDLDRMFYTISCWRENQDAADLCQNPIYPYNTGGYDLRGSVAKYEKAEKIGRH